MLFEYLDRLREKPYHVRLRVAFGTATMVTLVIALVWFSSLPTLFEGFQQEAAVVGSSDESLLNILRDGVNDLVEDSTAGVGGIESALEDAVRENPEEFAALIEAYATSTGGLSSTTLPRNVPEEEETGEEVILIATTSETVLE